MGVVAQGQAQGAGKVSLGGNINLEQLGAGSPAMFSAVLFVALLAIIVVVALSLR